MLRSKFLYELFKHNKNKIIKYNFPKSFDIQNQIKVKILKIDKKISENTSALMEAQIVKFRSNFSRSNNLFDDLGKSFYKTKLEDSINWHQRQLKELYLERKELKVKLEKIQGIFWLSRIKRFLTNLLIGILFLFSLLIFISGFMIIIYSLPLILLIIVGYLFITKK